MISLQFEKAYQYDEALRYKKAILKADLREKHRKAILEEMDKGLPEYSRPLWKAPKQKRKLDLLKSVRMLLP